ncbi:hypothetical protein PPROV_000736100 [Pycnococcus provasolii]|uniref:Uncharacterized protein n=1 Tax=Pycnococcus provasolii TaxID=41880 RepID=A0A830HN72_9CHLO|nr:hypothetical protein PPROV_000736100 [Pycnococcus provasolii]
MASGPTFDGPPTGPRPDPAVDVAGFFQHRDAVVKEKFVRIETSKIIKEKLKLCYLREGVNHLENCSELATAYMDSLRGTGIYKIHNAHHARDVVKRGGQL